MKIIVLTGGIATGKSTVSQYLIQKGYPVIDSDKIARQVVEPGSNGLEQLVTHFGIEILNEYGELNRQVFGDMIFGRKDLIRQVNQILHPLIFEAMESAIQSYRNQGQALVFLDIPLYYEVNKSYQEDQVWLVYVPEDVQSDRLQKRNHLDNEQVKQRIQSQLSIEEKLKLADVIIDNQGAVEDLYHQVDRLLENI